MKQASSATHCGIGKSEGDARVNAQSAAGEQKASPQGGDARLLRSVPGLTDTQLSAPCFPRGSGGGRPCGAAGRICCGQPERGLGLRPRRQPGAPAAPSPPAVRSSSRRAARGGAGPGLAAATSRRAAGSAPRSAPRRSPAARSRRQRRAGSLGRGWAWGYQSCYPGRRR